GLLLPLATDRAWPMTQLAVLRMLPGPVRRAGGLPPQHLGPLLVAAGSLDPPPLPAERAGLAGLGRAIGPRVLVGMLAAKDVRRLGAARLLALTGLPLAERALARMLEDPSEEMRLMARTAARARRSRGAATEEAAPRQDGAPGTAGRRSRPSRVDLPEPPVDEPVLIASLARALGDPGEPVRIQAAAALDLVHREVLTDWAIRSLDHGTVELAELAATVAGRLALTPVAANLLRRAALTQPEERGPYLAALHAIGPD